MFIELTDHLRCTEPHDEQFLVLLPGPLDGRRVVAGDLGCPVCGRVVTLREGVADFGGGVPAAAATALTAEAVSVLLGLTGPGGFVAMIGSATSTAAALAVLLPGVRLVLVNPSVLAEDSDQASVLRGGRLPLKRGSMRGVVVGEDVAGDRAWVSDAAGAALPGLRVVVAGVAPVEEEGVEILMASEACWVGRRK